MKIESSKNTQTENRTEKKAARTGKSETAFQSMFDKSQKIDSQTKTAGFARILDEARNQNVKDKDSLFDRKNERSEQSTETAEADKGEETNKAFQNQEKADDEQPGGGSEQSDKQDNNAVFAPPNLSTAMKPTTEITVPAARSILHVADLERIVSTVRAQNLKNVEQVVIALKHSVLEGLQIKLTIAENGILKAEFLALNEQIKNQLNARKQEIRQIFRERGVKLSDLSIRQGAEFADPANHSGSDTLVSKNENLRTTDQTAEADDSGSQTAYRI